MNDAQTRDEALRWAEVIERLVPLRLNDCNTLDDLVEWLRRVGAAQDGAAPQAPVWRCFHCDECFAEVSAAREHFGASEHDKPACQIDITHVRWLEAQWRRQLEDDTEAMRHVRGVLSEHERLRREAEELGYARGLRDAQKRPEELGLQRIAAGAAPQAAEPLYLLHTGQIDSSGEQDDFDVECNSYKAVEAFCRQHPAQVIGLYPAALAAGAAPQAAELTDEQMWSRLPFPWQSLARDVQQAQDKLREFGFSASYLDWAIRMATALAARAVPAAPTKDTLGHSVAADSTPAAARPQGTVAGWLPIEAAPRATTEMFVVRAFNVSRSPGTTPYTSDPYCVWHSAHEGFIRWPHKFAPTHYLPLPEAPIEAGTVAGDQQ
jgi:hypothetical protein